MKLFKNKKGNWQDILDYIYLVAFIGFLAISFIVLWGKTNEQLLNTTIITNNTDATAVVNTFDDNLPRYWDFMIPLLYVGFVAFSIWSARKIPSSHKFLIVGIIMFIVVLFASLIFENLWDAFFTKFFTIFPRISELVFTKFMLDNLRITIFIYGLAVGWALYAKDE